jgi:hypothetical protein
MFIQRTMGHPLAALPSNVEDITASEVFDIPAMGAGPDSASAGRYLARQSPCVPDPRGQQATEQSDQHIEMRESG